MDRKERALLAIDALKKLYPDAVCSLTYEKPYELLISTRLSAQCTDKRVNIVTNELYSKYPTLESLAEAPIEDLEAIIRSLRSVSYKSARCQGALRRADRKMGRRAARYDGGPDLRFPVSDAKTANLVLGDVFGKPCIVTDTHCIRICGSWACRRGRTLTRWNSSSGRLFRPREGGAFCHRLFCSDGMSAPRARLIAISVR